MNNFIFSNYQPQSWSCFNPWCQINLLQVFAERLGLETGWNCHISLANYEPLPCRGSINESSVLHSETDGLIAGSKSNIAEGLSIYHNVALTHFTDVH